MMDRQTDIVTRAEQVMQKLKKRNVLITTSQIRKFLTAVSVLNNKVQRFEIKERQIQATKDLTSTLPDELVMQIKYLKIIMAYQSGKNRKKNDRNDERNEVYQFIREAKLNEFIDDIGTDLAKYKEFAKYVEALVAYHKFYGGKD